MEEKENFDVTDENSVVHPDYASEIVSIIRSKLSPKILKDKLFDYHENDIAIALERLTREERVRLYSIFDADTLTDILEYTDDVGSYFDELTVRKKIEILSHCEADAAVEYLSHLSKDERNMLIDLMDDESKRDIAIIASFDEDEIGSRMTTNYVYIGTGMSVKNAMKSLVSQASDHDSISTIYVLEDDKTFVGAIDLKDLIIAREGQDLYSVMITSYPYVYGTETIESCIERIKDYSEDSIPVLNDNNKMIGVITAQDIVEVVDDEFGEDYAKFAGLSAEEDLNEPLLKSLGKRLPWLLILFGLGIIVSSVVGIFSNVVSGLPLIVCFQSLILDMAGNSGTQSLAVTIRVLMDESLTGKQKAYHIFKEFRIGAVDGLLLGSISFVFVGLYIWFIKGENPDLAFSISMCTGIALLIAMTLSSLSGTLIPMMFKKMKVDPAVASGPLITTLNDLVAVVTYYGLSWILLINVLNL